MSNIQVFDNPEFGKVTTAVIDGKDYFAATECAKALGYAEPEQAVRWMGESVNRAVA
jgi:prophage antirepressor-like protein